MLRLALITFILCCNSVLATDLGNGVDYIPVSRKLGVGVKSPSEQLSINGSAAIKESSAPSNLTGYGKIYVASGNKELYFLASDQSAVKITNNGSLASSGGSPGGSNTWFQFNDSSSFAGNGALAFTKASKTLAVAANAPFDIDSTSLSIADTNITLDGATTTFTQTGATGTLTMTPKANANFVVQQSQNGQAQFNNSSGSIITILNSHSSFGNPSATSIFGDAVIKFKQNGVAMYTLGFYANGNTFRIGDENGLGTGRFVLDTNGNIGIGMTSPNAKLTVAGVLSLNETTAPSSTSNYGKIYANSSNSKLYFKDDGGTAYNLTNGSAFNSSSYLRADASTTYSSGTITFNSGTTFDINSTAVSIADTDITLDGASTTFTQSSGAITMAPANGSNMNINLLGVSDFVVDTNKLIVNNNGNVGIGYVTPNQLLSINGAISIKETSAPSQSSNFGKLFVDSSTSNLKFLDDSGTSYDLLSGGGGSGTPGGSNTQFQFNDSGSFAGNGALAFTKASKTLTIPSDAPLDINSTSVSIADTDITLDGASTTFTQSSGAITMTAANGSNMNINLLGISDFAVDTNKLIVNNNGNVGIGYTTPNQLLSINGAISMKEVSAPSSSSNFGKLYTNSSNSKLYFMDDSGNAYNLINGSSLTDGNTLHMARMIRASAQSIPDATWTQIDFDTESYDNGGIADATANSFTILHNGTYLVQAMWHFVSSDNNQTRVEIRVNGSSVAQGFQNTLTSSSDARVSDVLKLHTNDVLTMYVQKTSTSGGSENTSTSNAHLPRMSVIEVPASLAVSGGGGGSGTPGGSNTQFQFNDSGSFAGNGAIAFTKASKTLTIPSDAPLDINSTTVSIADTDISFDGASTTFTGTGAMTITPGGGTNLNVSLSGAGDFAVNTNQLYVDTSAANVGISDTTPAALLDVNGSTMTKVITNKSFYNNTSGTTVNLNWNNGNKQKITLGHNVSTLNLTAPTSGVGSFTLMIIQDGTGSRTITWPSSVKWPGGTPPTLSTAPGYIDIVTCIYDYDGADKYYCQIGLDLR